MAVLLSVLELRDQVGDQVGEASDATLLALLNGAEELVFLRNGNPTLSRETTHGTGRRLRLDRPALTIVRVVQNGVVLASTDYTLLQDNQTLERTFLGPNPGHLWSGMVTVEYVPNEPVQLFRQVIVRLVKQDLAYSGYIREASEDVSRTRGDYAAEREAILRDLPQRGLGFA